jgi:AcrR family transcriptional regulator
MNDFQRARKPEEKELRRNSILESARELSLEQGPIHVGLNEIARNSGISKPNIYRYFESREDILYHLLLSEFTVFIKEVEAELGTQRSSIRLVSQCITHQFLKRPLLCQLMGMTSSILEHNLSIQAITRTKLEVRRLGGRFSAILHSALFWLSAEDAVWLANSISLYIASLWPASHPSDNAAVVLQKPEFAMMVVNAEKDLGKFVEALLTGLKG